MSPAGLTDKPKLAVRDLVTVYYSRTAGRAKGGGLVKAVDRVSFDLDSGQSLGLVGESGCGKSSLARTILRLVPARSGSVRFDDADILSVDEKELKDYRRKVQVVFQNPTDSLDPRMRIGAIVREPLDIHRRDWPAARRRQLALELLEEVGLSAKKARNYPHELSGGQRQRVGIARALITSPEVLICDEPVSSLDVSVQAQVLALLAERRAARSIALLFISHDVRVVGYLCERTMVMYRGRIVETAPTGRLLDRPLHPYTRLLLESVPRLDAHHQRSRQSAQPLAEDDFSGGCSFKSTCPQVDRRCLVDPPDLRRVGPERSVACHLVDEAEEG